MRIYAAADIHGRPERLELLERGVTRTTPDVLVAAGDMDGRDPAEVLGLEIVRLLTEQLNGTIAMEGRPGAVFRVGFEEPHYKPRI